MNRQSGLSKKIYFTVGLLVLSSSYAVTLLLVKYLLL